MPVGSRPSFIATARAHDGVSALRLCVASLCLAATALNAQPIMASNVDAQARLLSAVPELSARAPRFQTHTLGGRTVVRASPTVNGIDVIGADTVAVIDGFETRIVARPTLRTTGNFSTSPAQAVLSACGAVAGCLFRDPTVEAVDGFARRVFWAVGQTQAHAAYAVRVPAWNLADVRDVVVAADTGAILASSPTVKFVDVAGHMFPGFQPSSPDANLASEPEPIVVHDVESAEVGSPLKGSHFETYNCCKQYTCIDDSSTCIDGPDCSMDANVCADYQECVAGTCQLRDGVDVEDVAVCAASGDEGAIDSFVNLTIPKTSLPAAVQNFIQGDVLYARVAFCTELPRLAIAAGAGENGEDGFFPTPVDKDRSEDDLLGRAAEEDAFAELAAYTATENYFQYIRDLLDEPGFCLSQRSMACDESGDALRGEDDKPLLPFHIATNVLFPEVDFTVIGQQLLGGAGTTPGNPLVVDDYQRIPNAAFIPALEGGPVQVPPEFAALAALFTRPFDSNVYFQGFRDFAYDGDVVRHEFTHGIIHSYNPDLLSVFRDDWGAHAFPGALNEGWSDYFSSAFNNDTEMGEYASDRLVPSAETGLRDADNDKRCPENIIGEVHADAEPWTGALWQVRDSLDDADVEAYDRALLLAVAGSAADEDFASASTHAVDAVRSALGDDIATRLADTLATRGISACERVWPLQVVTDDEATVTRMDTLFQPGANDIGLSNFAPSVVQFRVEVPAGADTLALSWGQASGGLAAQFGGGGGTAEPMLVLVHETTDRIHWTYEGASGGLAVPRDADGAEIAFDAAATKNAATIGAPNQSTGVAAASFNHALEPSCEPRTFVIQLLAPAGGAQLSDVDVAFTTGDAACDAKADDKSGDEETGGCGCNTSRSGVAFAAVGLLLLRWRRRR